MNVFINPYTDFGFQKLFGEKKNEHLLISLLNDLLDDREVIVDLSFKKTEHLSTNTAGRKTIFDIVCTNDQDEHFIVELQKPTYSCMTLLIHPESGFLSPSLSPPQQAANILLDFASPNRRNTEIDNGDLTLKAIYCIDILDFSFSEGKAKKDVIHSVQLKNQHNQVFYDRLNFIYVEVPNFNKSLKQLDNHCDHWLYFLKNLADLQQVPELFLDDVIYQGFEIARVASLNDKELLDYQVSLQEYRDLHNIMQAAKQEGFDKGKAKSQAGAFELGIKQERLNQQQQRHQEKIVLARQMLASNLSPKNVARFSGLSEENINALLN